MEGVGERGSTTSSSSREVRGRRSRWVRGEWTGEEEGERERDRSEVAVEAVERGDKEGAASDEAGDEVEGEEEEVSCTFLVSLTSCW